MIISYIIDLFHNGGLLILFYYFICMIISLSNLVSMWKIQRKTFFQTRSERLIIIYVKEHINRPPLWKRSIITPHLITPFCSLQQFTVTKDIIRRLCLPQFQLPAVGREKWPPWVESLLIGFLVVSLVFRSGSLVHRVSYELSSCGNWHWSQSKITLFRVSVSTVKYFALRLQFFFQ